MKEEKKTYTQAPLPFMGQKRRWNQEFKRILKTEFTDCNTFVDLFGGSGLLSHFTKSVRPDAKVVYNDYDNYSRGCVKIRRALDFFTSKPRLFRSGALSCPKVFVPLEKV